jgi:cell wall-associated NlpC family hydrolase
MATGSVDLGDPGRLDRDVFTAGNFLDQGQLQQSFRVAVSAPHATLSGVLEKAETMIGVPSLWGGNAPAQGLDCSGFVRYVYEKAAGIPLPRLSAQIGRKGSAIAQSELHPGDLVFFNTPRGETTHAGIHVGEQRFIHAPKRGAFIRIESNRIESNRIDEERLLDVPILRRTASRGMTRRLDARAAMRRRRHSKEKTPDEFIGRFYIRR